MIVGTPVAKLVRTAGGSGVVVMMPAAMDKAEGAGPTADVDAEMPLPAAPDTAPFPPSPSIPPSGDAEELPTGDAEFAAAALLFGGAVAWTVAPLDRGRPALPA